MRAHAAVLDARAAAPSAGWIRSAWWDIGVIAFGWLPFYAYACTTPLVYVDEMPGWRAAFEAALAFVLALNFVHRHYVLVLVYGDPAAFRKRARAYVLAPLITLAIVAAALLADVGWPSDLLFGALALWNVWHVLQQRYGLLRYYARGTDASSAHFDRAFVWAALVATVALTLTVHGDLVLRHPLVQPTLGTLAPLLDSARPITIAVLGVSGAIVVGWFVRESIAVLRGRHVARFAHAASTIALLSVFAVHGAVLGYLCFGLAHSLEYLGFVHGTLPRRTNSLRGLPRLVFASLARAPLAVAPFVLAYYAAEPAWASTSFVIAYTTTSALHYLYDGWIWRRPAAGT